MRLGPSRWTGRARLELAGRGSHPGFLVEPRDPRREARSVFGPRRQPAGADTHRAEHGPGSARQEEESVMRKLIVNVGTIGHVDHGKTTLTSALTHVMAHRH